MPIPGCQVKSATNELPVIDLCGLADNSRLQAIADDIAKAMRNSGFMYVKSHGINQETIDSLIKQQELFFNQTLIEKQVIAINNDNRGYLAQGMAKMHGAEHHDQKEVFFWGAELDSRHPDRVNKVALCGDNQWPEKPPGFSAAVLAYADAVRTIGDHLLRAFARSLNIDDDFFCTHYTSPLTRGQLIHYPPTRGDADNFGVAAHTDFGCITLLLQRTAGLEVLGQNGQWVSAPPIPGTLVVNIGDLLERWTDGRLPSTRHRVRNLTNQARYSIAMFHDPNPTAVINPEHMGSNTGRFTPVTAADYIVGRNRGAFTHYGEVEPN